MNDKFNNKSSSLNQSWKKTFLLTADWEGGKIMFLQAATITILTAFIVQTLGVNDLDLGWYMYMFFATVVLIIFAEVSLISRRKRRRLYGGFVAYLWVKVCLALFAYHLTLTGHIVMAGFFTLVAGAFFLIDCLVNRMGAKAYNSGSGATNQ